MASAEPLFYQELSITRTVGLGQEQELGLWRGMGEGPWMEGNGVLAMVQEQKQKQE